MTLPTQDILKKSVVVVAHPDDEILWFSSILAEVGELIVCFTDVPANPVWSSGRARSLADYPLPNLTRLDLTEAGIFQSVDWTSPQETAYGLAIANSATSDIPYRRNYAKLLTTLAERLSDARSVFTHNPWGEYGNAEHIQVYRAICALQQSLDFDLWVPSYFSNKSASLMLRSMALLGSDYLTLPTDTKLANRIADLYRKNQCWTWYDDYQWPDAETYFLVSGAGTRESGTGSVRNLQFIQVDESTVIKSNRGLFRKPRKIFGRFIDKLGRRGST